MKQYQLTILDNSHIEIRKEGNSFEPTIVKEIDATNEFYNTMEVLLSMYIGVNTDPIIDTLFNKIKTTDNEG